jgi:hypothetical protein
MTFDFQQQSTHHRISRLAQNQAQAHSHLALLTTILFLHFLLLQRKISGGQPLRGPPSIDEEAAQVVQLYRLEFVSQQHQQLSRLLAYEPAHKYHNDHLYEQS